MMLRRAERGQDSPDGWTAVTLDAGRGPVESRYYTVPGAAAAVVWVGGVGGGFDTPACELYPRLAHDFQTEGIASLRLRYRHPTVMEEAVADVMAGLAFLEGEKVRRIGLVGHSFGGAVVIQAAARSRHVRSVVTLATQSHGATPVGGLGPRCPVLLIHGTADAVLPSYCSQSVFAMAADPRQLHLIAGAGHGLDEAADEVTRLVGGFLRETLADSKPAARRGP